MEQNRFVSVLGDQEENFNEDRAEHLALDELFYEHKSNSYLKSHSFDPESGVFQVRTTGDGFIHAEHLSFSKWAERYKDSITDEKFVELKLRYG